jgi:hypothetical protein
VEGIKNEWVGFIDIIHCQYLSANTQLGTM